MVCSDKAIAPVCQRPITGAEVGDLGYTISIDPQTGEVVPWTHIIASMQHLDSILKKLE